jgi:hypothetical protein
MKSGDKIKKRSISPAEARRLAARFVIGNLFRGVRVCDGAAAKWNIDGVRRKDVWLVYRHEKRDDNWIPAQNLMVVCKRTGRVLYDHLAFSEGDVRPSRSEKSKPILKTGKRWLDSRWWE